MNGCFFSHILLVQPLISHGGSGQGGKRCKSSAEDSRPQSVSVSGLAHFSRSHAPRLPLSEHRPATSLRRRAAPLCRVAAAHSASLCDSRDNTQCLFGLCGPTGSFVIGTRCGAAKSSQFSSIKSLLVFRLNSKNFERWSASPRLGFITSSLNSSVVV